MTGNPGKRPLRKREPRPAGDMPQCPGWLDPEAQAKWRALVPELARLGLATSIDGDALAAYCQAWAEFKEATQTLQRAGRTFTTDTGQVKSHPSVSQQRTAWSAIRAFAALFGLEPSSRSRLPEKPAGDELEKFLDEDPRDEKT